MYGGSEGGCADLLRGLVWGSSGCAVVRVCVLLLMLVGGSLCERGAAGIGMQGITL